MCARIIPGDLARQIELELKPRLTYQARWSAGRQTGRQAGLIGLDLVAIWLKASLGIKLLTRFFENFCPLHSALNSALLNLPLVQFSVLANH